MLIGSITGFIIGVILGTIIYGILIFIVGKIGLGMEVDGIVPALKAGFIVALLAGLLGLALQAIGISLDDGLISAIIHLLVSAGLLQFAGDKIAGMRVKGFGGAIIAAIAIAVVSWLLVLVLKGVA
ncbi:MAG: phage holin family protein [Blastocatellales bacterium]